MCAQKPLTEDKLLTILALFFQQNVLSINMAASASKLHFILRVSNRIQNYLLGYFIEDICIFPKAYACSNLSLTRSCYSEICRGRNNRKFMSKQQNHYMPQDKKGMYIIFSKIQRSKAMNCLKYMV